MSSPKQCARKTNSESIRLAHAGDLFHYRWAATRVLNLISPTTELESVSVEGGITPCDNDYIIDVEECFSTKRVVYQLKYSNKHSTDECTLSFLGNTLNGFGKLFKKSKEKKRSTEYVFLTNRPVSATVKKMFALAPEDNHSLRTINKYLKLSVVHAKQFCQRFKIVDSVENSDQQLHNVECRLSALTSSRPMSDEARAFVMFVAERAASGPNNVLTKASVLSQLGCSGEYDLFPARTYYDKSFTTIETDGFKTAYKQIIGSKQAKIIVHATGGFGKSAFLQWVHSNDVLPGDSILYDCYGGGLYRNSNKFRHRIRDAFVEIANELYAQGLCDPILKWQTMSDDTICELFWRRISEAVTTIRRHGKKRFLFLLIDAADNAIIAAEENERTSSFVTHLIKASVPDGCRIVFTSRSERQHFADEVDDVLKVKLGGFSAAEVASLIESRIPESVSRALAASVRSFGKGNPRVILNLLSISKSINDLEGLLLTDAPRTVPALLKQKIDDFRCSIRRDHDKTELNSLERLFNTLAVLPPTIPITVLSRVSGVTPELVESFISEFGTSFWFDHDVIHFRDEPTEAYFRNTYGRSIDCKRNVLNGLEKLGPEDSYAALTVPKLLFEIGDYERLFALTATKNGIPASNKTEARHLWLVRLEYAYRAALKLQRFPNVISLAFLLASEYCGDDRQKSLMLDHLPFIAKRTTEDEVEFLCRDKNLAWGWNGSHNLVISVLKAVRNNESPVARFYLESTIDWIRESFRSRQLKRRSSSRQAQSFTEAICMPSESQIALTALVVYLIHGVSQCAKFLANWIPATSRFRIARFLAFHLFSMGENADALLSLSNAMETDAAVNLALNLALSGYGKCVGVKSVKSMISFLKSSEVFSDPSLLPHDDYYSQAILAACEVAARIKSLRKDVAKIVASRVIRHTPYQAERYFEQRNYVFLRAWALWLVVTNKSCGACDFGSMVDKRYHYSNEYEKRRAISEVEKRIDFHLAMEKFFIWLNVEDLRQALMAYDKILNSHEIRDWEQWEIDSACIELKLRAKCLGVKDKDVQNPSAWLCQKIRIKQIIDVARRLMSFGIAKDGMLYLKKAELDLNDTKEHIAVEEIANSLLKMSEIAVRVDESLSRHFFDKAFDVLSVIDDETLQHFDAVNSLMRKAGENKLNDKTVVRFLRCAEHAYHFDSKHFDSEQAFGVLAKNNMTDALAALSRFRDRGFDDFGYVLVSLLKSLVQYHGFSYEEVWSMRFFLGTHTQLQLLEFILSTSHDSNIQQKCFDEFVDVFSKRIGRIDATWTRLSDLAKQFSLKGKQLQGYIRVVNNQKNRNKAGSVISARKTRSVLSKAMRGVNYSSKTWLMDYFKQTLEIHDRFVAIRELFAGLPLEQYNNLFEQMAMPNGISLWNVCDILEQFPRKNLGPNSDRTWNVAVGKIAKRFASEGEVEFLNQLVNYLSNVSARQSCLRNCLSECSETIGIESNLCYAIIKMASQIINPDEAEQLAIKRIDSFETEISNALGDPPDESYEMDLAEPCQAVAGLLWSALGSPVAWYRWNATYCVSALIENGCHRLVNAVQTIPNDFVSKQYLSSGATFFDGFAEMFFAIAINHAAAKSPRSIIDLIPCIVAKSNNSRNAIIKWHYIEALRKCNEVFGNPNKKIIDEFRHEISPRTPPIMMKSWGDCLPYAWDDSIMKAPSCIMEYDVEKYWLPPLARVFGINDCAFLSLFVRAFLRVSNRYDNWVDRMRYDYEKRDYRNESCSHSHGSYPCAFTFSSYVSFIALGELAYELLPNYPVVSYSVEDDDEWRNWLNEHLLERLDGLWLSDECDQVPIVFVHDNQYVSELDENVLTHKQCEKVLKFASPIENGVAIGGGWETSAMRNRLSTRFYCILVPRGAGNKYVLQLRASGNKYGYPIPDLYSDFGKPPFLCKGKWRGILQSRRCDDWSHFERFDPNYGGFDRHQIMIHCEIQKALQAKRGNLGKSLYRGRKEIVRLVRWGTGEDAWSRHEGPTHVGSVLWMSQQVISEIETRLQCEIIVGARVERRNRFQSWDTKNTQWSFVWKLARKCH